MRRDYTHEPNQDRRSSHGGNSVVLTFLKQTSDLRPQSTAFFKHESHLRSKLKMHAKQEKTEWASKNVTFSLL